MFKEISWQGYWVTLAITLAGYYLIVFLFYYKKGFKLWLSHISLAKTEYSPTEHLFVEGETEMMIDDCMDQVTAFFEQAKSNKCVKSELIHSLQKILRKYPSLPNSGYKEFVSKSIAAQCKHICSVRLNEDDVGRVWLDL